MGIKQTHGALVASVDEKGPAKPAGIETGDVIVNFDGHEIKAVRDLPHVVADMPVGKEVRVIVVRNGKEETKTLKVGRLEDGERQAALTKNEGPPSARNAKSVLSKTFGLDTR